MKCSGLKEEAETWILSQTEVRAVMARTFFQLRNAGPAVRNSNNETGAAAMRSKGTEIVGGVEPQGVAGSAKRCLRVGTVAGVKEIR